MENVLYLHWNLSLVNVLVEVFAWHVTLIIGLNSKL